MPISYRRCYQSYTGYFGNEACTSTFYAAAAIVFTVPACNSRGREIAILKASQALGNPALSSSSPGKSAQSNHAATGQPQQKEAAGGGGTGGGASSSSPSSTVTWNHPSSGGGGSMVGDSEGRSASSSTSGPTRGHFSSIPPRSGADVSSNSSDFASKQSNGGTSSSFVGAGPNLAAAAAAADVVSSGGAFEGLRRGLDLAGEEQAWHKYYHAWKKGKPDINKAMAVEMARKYGVSEEGTTAHILSRVEKAASNKRHRELDRIMRVQEEGGDLDDYEFTELNV